MTGFSQGTLYFLFFNDHSVSYPLYQNNSHDPLLSHLIWRDAVFHKFPEILDGRVTPAFIQDSDKLNTAIMVKTNANKINN